MLLVDAVHVIETVGGVLIWISAIAFILLGVMVGVRRKSGGKLSSARMRQLNSLRKRRGHPFRKHQRVKSPKRCLRINL